MYSIQDHIIHQLPLYIRTKYQLTQDIVATNKKSDIVVHLQFMDVRNCEWWQCTICSEKYTSNDWTQHINKKKHKQNRQKLLDAFVCYTPNL